MPNIHYVEWQGKRRPLADLAREYGQDVNNVYRRYVVDKWPIERALLAPARMGKLGIVVEWNGEKRYLSDLAREHGLRPFTAWQRYCKLGWTLEETLLTPARHGRRPSVTVRWKGKECYLSDLAKEQGREYNVLYRRVVIGGLSAEAALKCR